MLYYEAIEQNTLGVLKKIREIEKFSALRLVGGTALALQIGHRKSIDLDFFGTIDADDITFFEELEKVGEVAVLKKSKNINIFTIDGVKVDFVNYHYKWLENVNTEDGLLLARIKDIAAMKISAITGRGTKKVFIDLYFLLKRYTLKEILEFYMQKYNDASLFLTIKSLTYFEDAEGYDMPEMLIPVDWNEVKTVIADTVKDYVKSLD